MPTVPLFIRQRLYDQLREIERITNIAWQEHVRTAIRIYIEKGFWRDLDGQGKKKKVQEGGA